MSEGKKPILEVHDTTIPHLDMIERCILDLLVKQGNAIIIPAPTGGQP